jgi:hypothetical protein
MAQVCRSTWGVSPLRRERRATFGGEVLVEGDARCDGVVAESAPGAGGKQRIVVKAATLSAPCAQDGDVGRGEWDATLLAALAVTADMGAGAQLDVAAAEPGEFREP